MLLFLKKRFLKGVKLTLIEVDGLLHGEQLLKIGLFLLGELVLLVLEKIGELFSKRLFQLFEHFLSFNFDFLDFTLFSTQLFFEIDFSLSYFTTFLLLFFQNQDKFLFLGNQSIFTSCFELL